MKPQTPFNPAELPLRDVHIPAPISWWPPAPGWWLLLAALVLVTAAGIWQWRRRQQRRVLRQLLAELETLQQTYQNERNATASVQQLSVLLRRAMLSFFPRHDVAGLTGENWLSFLTQHTGAPGFSDDTGRLLTEAPYRNAADIDPQQMQTLFARTRIALQRAFEQRAAKQWGRK